MVGVLRSKLLTSREQTVRTTAAFATIYPDTLPVGLPFVGYHRGSNHKEPRRKEVAACGATNHASALTPASRGVASIILGYFSSGGEIW